MKKKIPEVISILKKTYLNPKCGLDYKNPLELIISARLSAQCTDLKVSKVTPSLFEKFPNMESFAEANVEEIEKYIHPCGIYKVKSRDIVSMCTKLIKNYNGEIPDNLEELIKLPGIGRKTANLILGEIFKKPAIIVDTHFMRITRKLGFHNSKNPYEIEKIMKNILPKSESTDFCHRIVLHGKNVCKAVGPQCEKCRVNNYCNGL
ncbi:MAG: endonuclease III [Candidatus Paraimprobicoccus trichonymphae]|uniref:Endonuclease III n=1 Tax=Candidatus Paraimprobicoccus trichonymphae TaxID=3033793 RepID=A0AA48I4S6_9FIRM|nr:MAG: endonuclease III [Candidatus Paraimprobicoccus trichonymphae]